MNNSEVIPDTIFIIPYRDRESDKKKFIEYMTDYLDEYDGIYKFYFSHQCDKRPFNRGATKNIGFLAMKKMYPNHYKNITFIFHDVDTLPKIKGSIPYKTTHGVVCHYYGATFALGGMFAIKGSDFEKTNGFPNFWGWGLEDNLIQDRCLRVGLQIDRSIFFKMRDFTNIYRSTHDGLIRTLSKRDSVVYKYETPDSMNDIKNLTFNINNEMINIQSFQVTMNDEDQDYFKQDVSRNSRVTIPRGYFRRNWSLNYMMRK
jgi:hypothetical protein